MSNHTMELSHNDVLRDTSCQHEKIFASGFLVCVNCGETFGNHISAGFEDNTDPEFEMINTRDKWYMTFKYGRKNSKDKSGNIIRNSMIFRESNYKSGKEKREMFLKIHIQKYGTQLHIPKSVVNEAVKYAQVNYPSNKRMYNLQYVSAWCLFRIGREFSIPLLREDFHDLFRKEQIPYIFKLEKKFFMYHVKRRPEVGKEYYSNMLSRFANMLQLPFKVNYLAQNILNKIKNPTKINVAGILYYSALRSGIRIYQRVFNEKFDVCEVTIRDKANKLKMMFPY